jgi:hypothetical protein
MKCWKVVSMDYNSSDIRISFEEFQGIDRNKTCKYFSNETNARNYYNKLIAERKPKTKWLADEFQVLEINPTIYNNKNVFNNGDILIPTSPKGKFFDNEKDALLHHAKLKYPVGTKFKGLTQPDERIFVSDGNPYWMSDVCLMMCQMIILNNVKGKWAEIVKEEPKTIEVEIPDGYTETEDKQSMLFNTIDDNVKYVGIQIKKKASVKYSIVTTDDVRLYEGDKVIYCNIYSGNIWETTVKKDIVPNETYLHFSTKKAAEKYLFNLEVQKLKEKYNQ